MPRRLSVNRKRIGATVAIGLGVIIGVAILVARCPWPACHYLNLNTYTITTVDEYRQFLMNASAFTAFHHVAAVKLDCSALRDDVVGMLQSGRLVVPLSTTSEAQGAIPEPDLSTFWLEGRILHIGNNSLESPRQLEEWAANVQQTIANQEEDSLSFLSRLFGGLILHIHNKQKPIVLFSREPCP